MISSVMQWLVEETANGGRRMVLVVSVYIHMCW